MKKLVGLIIGLCCLLQISGCVSNKNTVDYPPAMGKIAADELLSKYPSFSQSYDEYSVSQQEIELIKQWPNDVTIDVFFGTWCHDSVREVPRLLKLLAQQNNIKVNLMAINFQKNAPAELLAGKSISFTPTFIIYRSGTELARIIERPKNGSLVSDLTEILAIK